MFIDFPEVHIPVEGIEKIKIPKMITIKQKYDDAKIIDIVNHLRGQLMETISDKNSYLGKRICITAGSRGIPDLDIMIRTICDVLKEWGAEPFIVPSMGSHGGATADGQLEVLSSYNITEESMGVPIMSSMEVVKYSTLDGIPLYCDKYAYESDGIVIFNKVKPHTDFRGPHESGLAKMMAIGLANHKGASMFHTFGFHRFTELIPKVCEHFLENCPVSFGVGVVQNAYDEICNIDVCTKENFLKKDAELLEIAKEKIAKLKFMDVDLLIIDEIGKNISGNGYDPNIVGRNISNSFSGILNLKKLFVRSITEESHHSGAGLATADITTRHCLNDVDWEVTWTNIVTTGVLSGGRIPMYVNTDKEAILICIKSCSGIDYNEARIARIKNTLYMDQIQVSEALYNDINGRNDVEFLIGPEEMKFDSNGFII